VHDRSWRRVAQDERTYYKIISTLPLIAMTRRHLLERRRSQEKCCIEDPPAPDLSTDRRHWRWKYSLCASSASRRHIATLLDLPIQESQPVQKDQEWNHMQINACEQLPLGRMRRTWDVVRVVVGIACEGLIGARIILHILHVVVVR
jgi:hypothetical protein